VKIRKAVVTAAAPKQRTLPLQTVVDRDGETKSALQVILQEALAAGAEQVGVVVCPGDEKSYAEAAGPLAGQLSFLVQAEPRGYAHAVLCAREFTGSDPFLLLVGDHLYVSRSEQPCAWQLVAVAEEQQCAVSAVQATHESKLPWFGAVGGQRVTGRPGLYQVSTVAEKPSPTDAEQRLLVPGLRMGHYLCFFGMHVLPPAVMELLECELAAAGPGERANLSPALAKLAERERYLACELAGRRYDIGAHHGLLHAQLALALSSPEREEVLKLLVEVLADHVN
jgi:UTP--glucose-1-phosphate uridylyltransferase